MIKDRSFINSLIFEMKEWVKEGLITPEQQGKIESKYTPFLASSKKTESGQQISDGKKDAINIARVVIGLATLCLAAGIIIFYASNWRKMPPVVKLIQIFILMFAIYGSSLFFLDPRRKHQSIGSALLVLGIVSYGVGIMLVAQIYHISSHPTNGILAWGIGSLLISAIARERYGYYFSAVLFFIWNIWEITVFGGAGYFYIIPVLVTAFLLMDISDRRGITGSTLLAGWYIFQISLYWIFNYADDGWKGYLFTLLFVLVGSILILAARYLRSLDEMKSSGSVFRFCGWGMWLLPLILASHVEPEAGYTMFIWGAALLGASYLIKEYEGYYVSAAVFFLWSLTEAGTRGNLPWLYIFPAMLTGYLFYRRGDRAGIVVTSLAAIWYYMLFTWHFAAEAMEGSGIPDPLFIIMFLPAGAFFISGGSLMKHDEITSAGGSVLHIAGWLAALFPFFALSWPYKVENLSAFILFRDSAVLSAEYLLLIAGAAAAIYILRLKDDNVHLPALAAFLAAVGFILPMGNTETRMVSLHLGIIIIAGALLYFSYSFYEKYRIERGIAVTFILAMIIVKGIGFFGYSGVDTKFRLAYLAGCILFVTVCFLLNRILHHVIENRLYPHGLIDAACAVVLWLSVYLSSFETRNQMSIFSADRIVIIMIILFASIAIVFYSVILSKIRTGRVMIYLSMGILLSSGITMFIAGPDIPWEVYSVTFNLLLLIISGTYIYYSTVIQSKLILNGAIAGFIIHIITRYFDLFWDMFSGALLFIITGFIGLFGGYLLEKKRKDLAMQIEKLSADSEGVE